MVAALVCADRPDLPARLPADLLLLPQGVLPVVLDESARLRRRRAAHVLLGRDQAAADPQQHPPLLLVRRGRRRIDPHLRHGPRLRPGGGRVQRRSPGPRHADLRGEHRADLALHALLPLLPAHRRRQAAPLQQAPGPLSDVDLGLEPECQPRTLRLALALLCRHRRSVRLADLRRRVRRPEVLLIPTTFLAPSTALPPRTTARGPRKAF